MNEEIKKNTVINNETSEKVAKLHELFALMTANESLGLLKSIEKTIFPVIEAKIDMKSKEMIK